MAFIPVQRRKENPLPLEMVAISKNFCMTPSVIPGFAAPDGQRIIAVMLEYVPEATKETVIDIRTCEYLLCCARPAIGVCP